MIDDAGGSRPSASRYGWRILPIVPIVPIVRAAAAPGLMPSRDTFRICVLAATLTFLPTQPVAAQLSAGQSPAAQTSDSPAKIAVETISVNEQQFSEDTAPAAENRSQTPATAALSGSAAQSARAFTYADVWREHRLWIVAPLGALVLSVLFIAALIERNRRVGKLWKDLITVLQVQREDQKHLIDLSRHFELFLAHSVDFVYLKDAHGRYVFASDSVARALGSDDRKSLEGQRDEDIYPAEIAREYAGQEAELYRSGKPQLDLRRPYKRADGSTGWLSTHNWPVLSPRGESVLGLFGISRDITAEHAHESLLEHAANYDGLTGLPNRGLFFDRLQQAMAAVDRRGGEIAVVYVDVDGFKQVNDSHGHAVGDALLVRFATLLSSQLRRSDTVARLGGDEFALLLADLSCREESLLLLDRILVSVARPQSVAGVRLQMSASAGVAFYGSDRHSDPDLLLRQADDAMYQTKQAGRDGYRVFQAQKLDALTSLNESVSRGMDLHEFEVYYQPIVDLRSGSLVGLEALLRWRRDNGTVRLPDDFLPLLNDEAQSIELNRWVLRDVLRQQREWRDQNLHVPVHVNVTASDLGQIEFLSNLEADISEFLEDPEAQLVLEVSESTALADIKTINHVIEVCEGLGVGFAIAGFGTGYSSLSQARELATETVKVDRRFVQSMHTSPDALSLVSGILALARAFNRQVVAEGIETVEQGEMLLELGCYFAQGFAIASPMHASQVRDWLRDWVPDSRWINFSPGQSSLAASSRGLPKKSAYPILEIVR